ncbi:MerR family DNA-binding transcriptional regulator [Streptomyces mirabilis]|uniref:MerR family DNA-binding transcriptional regulator n=1 Tax=Streptomyces mirabilis TaxID=68239 RepID=UPI0036CA3E5B
MRIGELAKLTDTPARSLRYYEAQGLIEPRRLPNGYREYDDYLVGPGHPDPRADRQRYSHPDHQADAAVSRQPSQDRRR